MVRVDGMWKNVGCQEVQSVVKLSVTTKSLSPAASETGKPGGVLWDCRTDMPWDPDFPSQADCLESW